MKAIFLLSLCLLPCALAQVDLNSYPLQAELRPGVYTLYWGFDVEQETIRFAVRVATTGWVGFGLSPNGGMANSDVVIGWVNGEGAGFLDDRYARGEFQPAIDASQDWTLDGSMEDGGVTTLAFSRSWVTCDVNNEDRDIKADTTRVIFSWSNVDPSGDMSGNVDYHGMNNRGTQTLNLLGGQQEVPADPADLESFDILVSNIEVPNTDTTYWCHVLEFSAEIRNQQRFITKVAPVVTEGNELTVHHMLIYECDSLDDTHVGYSARCNSGGFVGSQVSICRRGTLLAAWAIGGGEFVYPENVAYPIGGAGAPRYLVMETHYDNPDSQSGIMDSSGMRFSYTSVPPTTQSGIIQLGHQVSRLMVIPPGADLYKVEGECSEECTSSQLPSGGITVFANVLHTHLVGVGLTLKHLRRSSSCGNQWRELQPIDQNLQYDFNYQQINHLPRAINVQPGDILRLECNYNTSNRTGVVLGGDSTIEEMCLSFLFYYPRIPLYNCYTNVRITETSGAYQPFLTDFLTMDQRNAVIAAQGSSSALQDALNVIDWSPEAIESLQTSIFNGPYQDNCVTTSSNTNRAYASGLPAIECPYQPFDVCDPDATMPPGDGATPLSASLTVVLVVALLAIFKL